MDAINSRRSIRRFSDREIPHDIICKIIESGIKAPSSKNRQPWKFMVIQGQAKEEMLRAFRAGIQREKSGRAMLPESSRHLRGAEYTVQIMEQAPVVIFVLNPLGKGLFAPLNDEDRIYELCNIQSVSAAIENMLLEATDLGIGSLWICDIFFADGWTAGVSWWQPWPSAIRRSRRHPGPEKGLRTWWSGDDETKGWSQNTGTETPGLKCRKYMQTIANRPHMCYDSAIIK